MKKAVKYGNELLEKICRNTRDVKVRKGVIQRKNERHLERIKNNIPLWYWHVLSFENRWPKRKLTWSPEGRNRRG
jgi:hypothetical protein